LWVVDDGLAVAFDGGYRAWRAAVADGWVPARAATRQPGIQAAAAVRVAAAPVAVAPARRHPRPQRLSKDAYRRQRAALDAELTRLGLRKNHLELAMQDPAVAANFVEMRRVASELADVGQALAAAEDAWLALEERAP
jgi:Uup-like ABC transporter family protein